MKNRQTLLAALALAALLFVGFTWQEQKPARAQWEYKAEYNISEKKLNELGAQGWELVAASPDAQTKNLTGFYFKRPK